VNKICPTENSHILYQAMARLVVSRVRWQLNILWNMEILESSIIGTRPERSFSKSSQGEWGEWGMGEKIKVYSYGGKARRKETTRKSKA
jgi:hypothetical protein